VPGADVKVPWELARMQHLPQLALARLASSDADVALRCEREIRNQILDFIATNPPRFGVNWATTMEVAIRVANWLVAWDLLRSAGAELDAGFRDTFGRSVLQHGRHIRNNLEWAAIERGNHYLADIVGLLFVAAWLPESREVRTWRTFARSEIFREARRQLNPDGSGIEASTSYHRLSAEMLTWAIAVLARLDGASSIPDWLCERLARAAEFSIDITRPNGNVVQIGDNDSGRFLKLKPVLDGATENHLDHRHLVAIIGALLGRPDLVQYGADWAVEGEIILALSGGPIRSLPARPHPAESVRVHKAPTGLRKGPGRAHQPTRLKLIIPLPEGAWERVKLRGYPDFGVYLYQSARVFLSIRCGNVGPRSVGSHAHNDQLGIDLSVDGRDLIRDPGSYVYTALPERRNEYRSVRAHFAPAIAGREPAVLSAGLFDIGRGARAQCLAFDEAGFVGVLWPEGGGTITASIGPGSDGLRLDYVYEDCAPDERWASATDWRDLLPTVPFSPGYGLLERAAG
jgi:hypothetical protein